MSDNKNNNPPERGQSDTADSHIASSSEVSSVAGSVKTSKTSQRMSSSSERQIKFERAQKCLENAALVSKRIKEHRKATAELLGRPFEEDDVGDTASEMASTMSERTGYSAATDTSTTLSVQDALNIPGISESLANTLKQKELLMERIRQYKEISKKPMTKPTTIRRESTVDTKVEARKAADHSDVTQLINTIKDKENSLSVMQVKMKAMETTILDLQEMINEKDQIIEAKNRATTLMSDSLSKKEKDSFILLEDTRQQMTKMQENFIAMESEWKEEKQKLLKEIETNNQKINSLEEANTILETSRFEISVAHSKLAEELESKNQEILRLQDKIESLAEITIEEQSPKEKDDVEEEKGSLEIAGMVELTKKIELLEQLNCQIRQTNKELENKLATVNTEPKSPSSIAPGKKGSPLPTRKGGRNTAAKIKSPWSQLSSESLPQESDKKTAKNEIARLEMLVQSLNKEILEKEYAISQKDVLISELKNAPVITEPKKSVELVDIGLCTDPPEDINKEEEHVEEVVPDINPRPNPVDENQSVDIKELEEKLKAAEEQIIILNNDIDAANKNMIKVKSNNKLKLKQLQKTIDNFSKVSDANAEIVKLNEELHQLSQKVAELEEEKGNLQLHLVDYDSGRLTDSDIYKKMVEMENLAETRLKAISVLEAQKFDLVQELHVLQQKNIEMEDKLADISQLQNEHVCTEMKSVQMEEQIDELTAAKKELELVIENVKLDKEHLNDTIKLLQNEKDEIAHKLENYIQENMELTDKLEKLSAEKVSSAESIEIVESLTTQEKLELEEYNKGISEGKDDQQEENSTSENDKNIDSLIQQREELNTKIELFTQERQEVMEKMTKIGSENESLLEKISHLSNQCSILENSIEMLTNEKQELHYLNQELTRQIEDLKRERIEIMKETAEIAKPSSEDIIDGVPAEAHHDDKSAGDKGNKGAKSVKQLTKEILKLKNTIKEREDEIADCQMKILSLEEHQQKQKELFKMNASNENKIKSLTDENYQLKQELEVAKKDKESEQKLHQLKQSNELLQQELQNAHQEYAVTVGSRDARINELESVLLEYEKQMYNYGNSLQQKDKEMAEYINQITKLNDVSQKLKSTIELLEEEKSKDQNAELVKSLNKQIAVYQKKMAENEEKIKALEEDKMQLHCMKGELVNKNSSLEAELKKLKDAFNEKQSFIKELQAQQQKHSEEMSAIMLQSKERDEEIHEIKLQLRKESIENEKLRNSISEKERQVDELVHQVEDNKAKVNLLSSEKDNSSERFVTLETKNKELMEKLKKFAITIKKKSAMYTELESQYEESQKQLSAKNLQLEQFLIQVETLPALQEKLKHAEEEINRLQSQKVALEQQKSHDINQLQVEMKSLQEKLVMSSHEISQLNDSVNVLHKDLHFAREENMHLKSQIDALNNKIVEHEIEQRNNTNLITKISSLEVDINQKQLQITDLLNKVEHYEQQQNQVQFGYDAKVQERDLYIENLEAEINKYKSRICRLEESISIMEDRRHSLERKADQLGTQLQEKQKAYSEYTSQEDELVGRLAVLMDHDRVLEKQLFEIDNENKELQFKVQHLNEDNQRLRKALSDIQEHYNVILEKANKFDIIEPEVSKYQTQLRDLEANLKRITHDHQSLMLQKKQEIEELESEFNTQIENAIKEKKVLSEKYEKINEYVSQLENKLHEYKTNIENLNINIDELHKINQELVEKSNKEVITTPDYTEQYIGEINKLNAMVNNKSQDILELNNTIQVQQMKVSNFESTILDLNAKLQESSSELEQLRLETIALKHDNNQLQAAVSQKEDQIKELKDNQKLTFEMNIPKTEGMIISSTIEQLSGDNRGIDMSSLESQIVSGFEEPPVESKHVHKKVSEKIQQQPMGDGSIIEPEIVAKKAYECFTKDGEENVTAEADPFNSDEGWGLGECDEVADITPGISHLNEQIQQLKTENNTLRAELETNNTKLLKALKKLKELKTSNDVLTNELKLAKQLSQSSFFDNAMEDELRLNVQELEKKLEELNTEINKEKRDKESLRKQNEVFHNANDRLTDMKDKLENEIELWKFKFKEANDKLSTLQWGADTKETQPSEQKSPVSDMDENKFKDELMKIEKENDELQMIVDQLNTQNKELLSHQTVLKNEISDLNKQLEQHETECQNCELVQNQLDEINKVNATLVQTNSVLTERVNSYENELSLGSEKINTINEHFKTQLEGLEKEKVSLLDENSRLQEEILSLKELHSDADKQITNLISEIEEVKSKLRWHEEQQNLNKFQNVDSLALAEKCSAVEQYCVQLKQGLDDANSKILQLESDNADSVQKSKDYQDQIKDLNTKIDNLNTENDNLLSTVAELRSSVSSAVDQRGFEIAELWKQHLAQRESDFQKVESDLRTQLSTSEAKYEQLLENVQSSNQEETSKLVVIEQVTSLQHKLEDKEEHIRNLQTKYAEVMNQLDMLRSEIEDEKVAQENKLLEQQEEYERIIQELTVNNHKNTQTYEETFKSIQNELMIFKSNNDKLNKVIEDLHGKIKEAEEKVIEVAHQLQLKESEIYQKTHDYTITLAQRNEEFENVRKQLIEYEKRVEELSYEKEAELAVLRLKIHERDSQYDKARSEGNAEKESLMKALNDKIIECTNLNKQIVDLNRDLESHSTKAAEMQAALENQEIEIVGLNDEITNLQNVLRSSSSKIQKHVSFASDTKPGTEGERSENVLNKDLLDAVPRAELDLALYMLHQRDVRCEELTMELTQLLEERDTLQLRLSDSLRSNEDMKNKAKVAGIDESMNSSQETITELPSFTIEKEFVDTHRGQTSRSSSISEQEQDKPKLQAKLTELRTVRHSRDVRLRQDSEQRQLDLRLLQRDVANLPPEAVDQLAQAHHTLSRDSQSTSTVLLNWLRGKSTPKVVHM